MSTITNPAEPTSSAPFLTLEEWDNATNEQRSAWLSDGRLISSEDGRILDARRRT